MSRAACDILVEPMIGTFNNGRRFVSSARVLQASCNSNLDKKLCAVVADNLEDSEMRNDFLELLDIGEWALRNACSRAGREFRMKPIPIWRELIHWDVLLSHDGPCHALLLICHYIRENLMLSQRTVDPFPLREPLLERVRQDKSGTLGLLILIFDLRYRESVNVDEILQLVRQASGHG